MSQTELSLGHSIRTSEFLAPDVRILPPRPADEESATIAPWLSPMEDEPPTPPPKQGRSFLPAHKPSFSSFGIPRQASSTDLYPRGRGSESSHSIAESSNSATLYNDSASTIAGTQAELRKVKSGLGLLNKFKRKQSRTRLSDEERPQSPGEIPPVPSNASSSYVSFHPMGPPSPPSSLFLPKRDRRRKKSSHQPPPLPPKDTEFSLDTNIDDMEGIIDRSFRSGGPDSASGSAGSAYEFYLLNERAQSDHTLLPSANPSMHPIFSDPFLASTSSSSPSAKRNRHLAFDQRKVSPKTLSPPPGFISSSTSLLGRGSSGEVKGPAWEPPQSWSTVNENGEDPAEPEYSSSEESVREVGRPVSVAMTSGAASTNKSKSRRKSGKSHRPGTQTYMIRIYRSNNTYHVASINLQVTVASLTPVLNQKLLLESDRESHKLYLKERGRERVLAQTERPADILRRRLEQAGYDVADGLDRLGAEDLSFLLKFVYKTQLLGPAEQELTFENYEYIDLTGQGLRTIPVVLHGHAETIVSLTLSKNPMLEIPLDFIQSCSTLRELRLSNMAIKKVPENVRYNTTLHRLDISCNRIVDLNDSGLDLIPELTTLKAQNNRLEKLPWFFPRLRALKYLNISNNKFRDLPAVVSEIAGLVDLDISFNMIVDIPEQIGQLKALERLIIVGNQVAKFPEECRGLVQLRELDCRRNNISDLSVVCRLPKLETLRADHNAINALDLSSGPCLTKLDASHNDITQLRLVPGPLGGSPYAITSLDISSAKLSSLDDFALAQLSSLLTLKLDHNDLRAIPESLGELSRLVKLSCSDNSLNAVPSCIDRLQKLEILDVHNNNLAELPVGLWNCASLCVINATSNCLDTFPDPPPITLPPLPPPSDTGVSAWNPSTMLPGRKPSSAGSIGSQAGRLLPPLVHSLERLYLGENKLTDDILPVLTILKELRVLNLSFNLFQALPSSFLKNLVDLEELYLSGNKLTNIPTEDLHRLTKLSTLFLNGNKLQALPAELGKVKSLVVLDVGSNILKYNINNWEFDWNWNFNKNLRYLNLSGNKRLEIKPDSTSQKLLASRGQAVLADFSGLPQLRVLGLMDVTTTFLQTIPEESDDRRIRTSVSEVNRMAYGIADNMGRNEHLNMIDLVKPEFRDKKDEAIFAMFGRAQSSPSTGRLSKYLGDKFLTVFAGQLATLNPVKSEKVEDALRRSFLKLNKLLHDELYTDSRKMSQASHPTASVPIDANATRSGASGIVLYFVGTTMYVANAGNALAVVSRGGAAKPVATKHDPFDRTEIARIRAAEGWVSPQGLVYDELDISRAFGFYHLAPVVNARPAIRAWELSALDEFVIVGNRGLWDYVSYQTAVDIARSERGDPMIAAQKLRDFAISYGAEGSTMIMVIAVADLFDVGPSRKQTMESLVEPDAYASLNKRRRPGLGDPIANRDLSRLDGEVPPPTGHVALVFTDIRNSTHLWEVNAGMPTAMRKHNLCLRRQLRFCGGYEVKTEGDAFMCSFPTALAALWWCMSVQLQLLKESWPLEILECEDGKEVYDAEGKLIARGLSVRMGIHCGTPVCEPDPITNRMDYFGPMVNRSSRIEGSAAGGQIMCSAEVVREIHARIHETEPDTEQSEYQSPGAINAIRGYGLVIVPVGEVKLKGLEIPEVLSIVYPKELAGRQDFKPSEAAANAAGSRVQFSVAQMRELALLCLRLEALASSRVFRPYPQQKPSLQPASGDIRSTPERESVVFYCNPDFLLPPMSEKATDLELTTLLDSLSGRIENALASLCEKRLPKESQAVVSALQNHGPLDERTLERLLSVLQDS